MIDDVASNLGTERRRVYDIVNVLECLNMASRVQKNMYQWVGKLHLESTLSRLKGLGEEWGIGEYLHSPHDKDPKVGGILNLLLLPCKYIYIYIYIWGGGILGSIVGGVRTRVILVLRECIWNVSTVSLFLPAFEDKILGFSSTSGGLFPWIHPG